MCGRCEKIEYPLENVQKSKLFMTTKTNRVKILIPRGKERVVYSVLGGKARVHACIGVL